MSSTDYQKSKVYSWEDKCVAPRIDRSPKSIDFLSSLVEYMWETIGRINPPKVHENRAYRVKSTGGRYMIQLASHMRNEHILVHELAHSLNLVEDDEQGHDGHGPNYVADYILLLTKFYGFDVMELIYSATSHGVDVNQGRLFASLGDLRDN